MSDTPWTIQRSKRKATPSSTSNAKRARFHDDVDPSSKRKQSTLTQIQFVQTPPTSFEDDTILQELPNTSGRMARSKSRSAQRQSKRSTLTQMDWLARGADTVDLMDDDMLPYDQENQPSRLQQTDGPQDTPASAKKRKIYGRQRSFIPDSSDEEADDMKGVVQRTVRRKSEECLAQSKANLTLEQAGRKDPAQKGSTKQGVSVAFLQSRRRKRRSQNCEESPDLSHVATYDISMSTENTSEPVVVQQSLLMQDPITPKARKAVNSPSQTPRSRLAFSQRTRPPSPRRSPRLERVPLSERSVNVLPASSREHKSRREISKVQRNMVKSTNIRLKERLPAVRPRVDEVEDSDEDAASLPHTSSVRDAPKSAYVDTAQPGAIIACSSDLIEIPQSSQVLQGAEMASSPPLGIDEVEQHPLSPRKAGDVSQVDAERDSDSDLGSPVANDTQFNRSLLQRTSSPIVGPHSSQRKNERTPVRINLLPDSHHVPNLGLSKDGRLYEEDMNEDMLATPRLVQRSEHRTISQIDGASLEQVLPRSASQAAFTSAIPSQTIHSDETTQSASSSALHMMPPITQKSIHPASIPRPSQVSTQDPTQGYPLVSSYMLMSDHAENENDNLDCITIKDSSSLRHASCEDVLPISQLRARRPNTQVIGDSEDEDELDLDLDLPPYSKESARKPVHFRNVKTERSVGSDPQDQKEVPGSRKATDRPLTPGSRMQANSIEDALEPPMSSPTPTTARKKYVRAPIPGFNNDTQANFTQGGHVTAAHIHRQRESGLIPEWYTPAPYQLQAFRETDGPKTEDGQ